MPKRKRKRKTWTEKLRDLDFETRPYLTEENLRLYENRTYPWELRLSKIRGRWHIEIENRDTEATLIFNTRSFYELASVFAITAAFQTER